MQLTGKVWSSTSIQDISPSNPMNRGDIYVTGDENSGYDVFIYFGSTPLASIPSPHESDDSDKDDWAKISNPKNGAKKFIITKNWFFIFLNRISHTYAVAVYVWEIFFLSY